MNLKNVNISSVLTVFVVVIISFTVLIGINGILSARKIKAQLDTMYLDRIIVLEQLKTTSDIISMEIPDIVNRFSHQQLSSNQAINEINSFQLEINQLWSDFKKTKIIDNEIVIANKADELLKNVHSTIEDLKNLLSSSHTNPINFHDYLDDQYLKGVRPFTLKLDELSHIQLSISNELYQNAKRINKRDAQTTSFIIIIAVLLGISFSIYIIKKLKKSFSAANEIINQISEGNLSIQFPEEKNDEIGQLMQSLQKMTNELNDVVSTVYESIDAISSASSELSSASQSISNGASSQALSLEMVTSSINKMKEGIVDNSVNAEKAETISKNAAEHIIDLSLKSTETSEQIKRISEKISIIEEIAFQTNILSLNAAVEAARAGEYGKGFGVVATEVGKLADRSKSASVEINQLSKKSVEVAEESKSILEGIIPKIQNTSELVLGINQASTSQGSEAQQIHQSIDNLNQVTHQNAASAEEMATSAEELSGQTMQLKEVFNFFKTDKTPIAKHKIQSIKKTEKAEKTTPSKTSFQHKIKNDLEVMKSKDIIDIKLDDDELDEDFERF